MSQHRTYSGTVCSGTSILSKTCRSHPSEITGKNQWMDGYSKYRWKPAGTGNYLLPGKIGYHRRESQVGQSL